MAEDDSYKEYGDSCVSVYPPDGFEGLWVERSKSGDVTYRGRFKKAGMRVGQHLSFWDNGALREISYWEDGWISGTSIRFNEDGGKQLEKDFGEYGGRTRSWTEKYFSDLGQLYMVKVWRDGNQLTEWLEPGFQQTWEQIDGNSIVAKAIRRMKNSE